MLIISFEIWLLASEPMHLGVFEGFDLTNPRDQLGGERSHPTWSKLGHRGERFLPHHSTSDLLSFRRFSTSVTGSDRAWAQLQGTSIRRAHHLEENRSI